MCKKGCLLAEIDSPEFDQQFSQARATSAPCKPMKIFLRHHRQHVLKELIKTDGVSKQEVRQRCRDMRKARRGRLGEANVRRLEELESFKKR